MKRLGACLRCSIALFTFYGSTVCLPVAGKISECASSECSDLITTTDDVSLLALRRQQDVVVVNNTDLVVANDTFFPGPKMLMGVVGSLTKSVPRSMKLPFMKLKENVMPQSAGEDSIAGRTPHGLYFDGDKFTPLEMITNEQAFASEMMFRLRGSPDLKDHGLKIISEADGAQTLMIPRGPKGILEWDWEWKKTASGTPHSPREAGICLSGWDVQNPGIVIFSDKITAAGVEKCHIFEDDSLEKPTPSAVLRAKRKFAKEKQLEQKLGKEAAEEEFKHDGRDGRWWMGIATLMNMVGSNMAKLGGMPNLDVREKANFHPETQQDQMSRDSMRADFDLGSMQTWSASSKRVKASTNCIHYEGIQFTEDHMLIPLGTRIPAFRGRTVSYPTASLDNVQGYEIYSYDEVRGLEIYTAYSLRIHAGNPFVKEVDERRLSLWRGVTDKDSYELPQMPHLAGPDPITNGRSFIVRHALKKAFNHYDDLGFWTRDECPKGKREQIFKAMYHQEDKMWHQGYERVGTFRRTGHKDLRSMYALSTAALDVMDCIKEFFDPVARHFSPFNIFNALAIMHAVMESEPLALQNLIYGHWDVLTFDGQKVVMGSEESGELVSVN
eukprot:gnl/TRDRNA2_/TRDRNA2_197992_c0_seq1.p1 gnl/TRDRNA2_/TRDRNA2_197992_c0~~gnl/TRDRNA2_/TRDRNA2_197992_c0_seq1.p1  ORF type:complete len:612 (-),score=72.92 gnl/TRDRNA2_/TRDRNA2_197992_c0_seq1:75-1910(-)